MTDRPDPDRDLLVGILQRVRLNPERRRALYGVFTMWLDFDRRQAEPPAPEDPETLDAISSMLRESKENT